MTMRKAIKKILDVHEKIRPITTVNLTKPNIRNGKNTSAEKGKSCMI